MLKKEILVKTRLENKNNWAIQRLVDRYTCGMVYIESPNDYDQFIKFIIKKSQIKKFTEELNFLDDLGIRGSIVE